MMFMMLWMVLFWAAVIVGVIWLVVPLRRRGGGDDALERLGVRLASGEIDVGEYGRCEAPLQRTAAERTLPALVPIIASAVALAVFVVIPAIVMSTNGWDMLDMHGRGHNTSDSPAVQGGSQANVRMEGFSFEPGNLEIPVGATVTWINEDSAPHDATARDGNWQTERLSNGDSDSITFDASGTYDYYCSIHPGMNARLIVR